ncbi:LytR/AlgR family response regulator transcription factor [Emticicia sp.]|uniref:LytR/AlgR family response regulator transcription factor n=1 Tax=Emticicia sp. TaxID=1930953 RepID=UPI0037525798
MKAIIIDDEPNAVELLVLRLAQKCPQIEVVAQFTNSVKGVEAIKLHQPDIVFLDIEMPQLNGFQVLEAVEDIPFHLIFVTAYDKFALKAFRYSAIDYLLKPIETQELIEAVSKVEKQIKTSKEQVNHFRNQYQNFNKTLPDKIALPYQNGVTFVAIKDIVYCEADNTYTKVFMNDGQHFLVTKTLLSIQEVLEEREFLRVHRQYIINLNQIKKYVKGEGNYLIMNNDKSIPIGRSQKDKLIEKFGWL